MKSTILITDGENRSALAAVRSLGKRGHTVFVSATSGKSLAASSKYCSEGIAAPDPLFEDHSYIDAIMAIAQDREVDFIFPMTESSIYLLNGARSRLPRRTTLACPTEEVMTGVSDKFSLFQMAERLQVAIPQTFYVKRREDLPDIIQSVTDYPVVVKPALSKIKVGGGFLSSGVKYASAREELEKMYSSDPVLAYPSLIQEIIRGPGTGLFTLYDRDRHLALFSHQRLREKPPSGGVSVVSESVDLDEEMVEAAGKLLRAVDFSGVAMVEFKRDDRDGKAKLMEINGRFWGTLQLAIASGVDFPALYLDFLCGRPISSSVGEYTRGHRMKWFLGTLDHLIIRLKHRDATLNLPPGSPSKARALFDFLKIREKNSSFDVFSIEDRGPFFREFRSYLGFR